MIIRKIEDKDLNDLIQFNSKIYPRRINIEESIKYRFYHNPFITKLSNENIIAKDSNDNIVGQVLMLPSELIYNKVKYPVYWAIDFFVDETSRGYSGFIIAKKAVSVNYHFGVGVSDIALKLHLALGERIAGYLVKYVKFSSLFSILKFIKKNKSGLIKSYVFPESIEIKGGKFIRVYDSKDIITEAGYWNEDLIELTRDQIFMDWRFFYYPNKYFIYKYIDDIESNNTIPIYFVVRSVKWRGVDCLLVVDYRLSLSNGDSLKKILKATTRLSQKLKIAASIFCSSLPNCDPLIRKQRFFKVGKKSVIVTKFLNDKENMNVEKNMIFVTPADSDVDFYYDNKF